jgi:carbon monoxide dehydrogenase subunit G
MKIEDEFTVSCPIDQVYKEINNIGDIGYCIAGVKDVQTLSEDESDWKIEARAGFMARTFRIRGMITERRPSELLAFAGSAPEVQIAGFVALTSLDPATTTCAVTIEIEVTGAFKSLVDQMAKRPQQQMIRQTIDNLRQRLNADAMGGVPGPRPATYAPAGRTRTFAPTVPTRSRGIVARIKERRNRRRRLEESVAALEPRMRAIETQLSELRTLLEEVRDARSAAPRSGDQRPPVYRKSSKARPVAPGTRPGP